MGDLKRLDLEIGAKMTDTSKRKSGAWNVYKPGYLALYGIVSIFIGLIIIATWSTGGVAFPGLLGIFFFVLTGRQLYLKGQPDRRA